MQDVSRALGAPIPGGRTAIRSLPVAAVAAAAIAAFGASPASAASSHKAPQRPHGGSVTLRLSTDLVTPGVPFNDAYVNGLPKAVSKDTNGQVQIKVYPNNELYKTQNLALAAAQRGQIDLVITNNLNAQPIIPAMDGPSLAFLAPNIAQYFKVLGPNTPFMQEANSEAQTHGLVIVGAGGASPGPGGVIFTSNTPTTQLSALKGQKVRVPGQGLLADELSTLGAQSVPLSTTEVAPAISAGTVSSAVGTASFALGELKGLVHGYLDSGTFQVGPYFLFASKQSWDRLSSGEQAGISEAASGIVNTWLKGITKDQAANDASLKKAGLWVTKLPASSQATLTKQFQKSSWLKFKSEDLAAYTALMKTRKQLGLK